MWGANKGLIHWHRQWKGKWKSNPITGLDSPWGFQEVKNPRFQDNRHTKVVGLSTLRTGRLYTTENIPGTRLRCRPGTSVGIATDYGLGGLGIESRWGRDFPPFKTGPGAQSASCTMGTGSFPGVKCGRGVLLTTHPLLVPRSWKSRAIPLPPSGSQPGL